MILSNSMLIPILVLLCLGLMIVMSMKPLYTFPLYFVLRYFEGIFLRGSRQRVMFAVQIAFFILYFITSIRRATSRKTSYPNKWISTSLILCFFSQLIFSLVGFINGYSLTDILINNYKYIEIYLFYYVISTSVRDTNDMEKMLNLLIPLAMILGIIELITTIRGGVGLLILMNFGSIIFSYSVMNSKKRWKLLAILSTLIVVFSQARSYMIAYFVSLIVSFLLFPRATRGKTINFAIPFAIVFIALIFSFSESDRVNMLLTRIAGLGEGLDVAGGYRWAEFQVAFSKFLEKPFGRGFGFLEYIFIRGMGNFEWGDYMHIVTGELLLKTGIFGTMLYYFLTFKTASNGYKHVKIAEQENSITLHSICIGGFAGLISRILFFNMSSHNTYGFLFLPIIFSDIFYHLYVYEKNTFNNSLF